MKSLLPIPQHAQDLRLAIFETNPELLCNVLLSKKLSVGLWQIEFAIIGESHFLKLEYDGRFVFQEVLACLLIPEHKSIFSHRFKQLDYLIHQYKAYEVAIDFSRQLPQWEENEQSLIYRFPKICGQIPITYLSWQITDSEISWKSLHSYPDEAGMTLVSSNSRFRWIDYLSEFR